MTPELQAYIDECLARGDALSLQLVASIYRLESERLMQVVQARWPRTPSPVRLPSRVRLVRDAEDAPL